MADAVGLSVGASKLAAKAVGGTSVTRSAVLTRFAHRPPEVGLPSENHRLDERGLIITDFVDRVGDPVPLVASDGSSHQAADVLADALRSLLYVLAGGPAPVDSIGVAYPAHWRPPAVDALWRSLATLPEFCEPKPVLLPDAVAALIALQDDPGVPARGIIAVCDFGATGTSITFADAARGFQPIAATVRDTVLSGDVVDQAILTRVVADLASTGAIDLSNTSAIGSLSRLRGQCRIAKERLSTSAVTSLAVELPGRRTEVRLTRKELVDTIEQPLAGFVEVLHDALRRSGIRTSDLVAVASFGGAARMPVLTTTLSEYLRVPIITNGHPELSPAIGSGIDGMRGAIDEGVTSIAAIASRSAQTLPPKPARRVPTGSADAGILDPRPRVEFVGEDLVAGTSAGPHWFRHPFALLAAGVGVVLAATATAAVFVLVRDLSPAPISAPVTTTSQIATATQTQPPPEPPALSTNIIPAPPPPLETVTQPAASAPANVPPPASTSEAPPPPASPSEVPPSPASPSEVPPSPASPSEVPPPPEEPTTEAQVPQIPAIPEIPPAPGPPLEAPRPVAVLPP